MESAAGSITANIIAGNQAAVRCARGPPPDLGRGNWLWRNGSRGDGASADSDRDGLAALGMAAAAQHVQWCAATLAVPDLRAGVAGRKRQREEETEPLEPELLPACLKSTPQAEDLLAEIKTRLRRSSALLQ